MSLSKLAAVRQQTRESAVDFVQHFRNVCSRCYSLSLSDRQLAELVYQDLIPQIRERFSLK